MSEPARPAFADPDQPAFLCRHVAVDHQPILFVAHDDDGWQFLCGEDHDDDEEPVVLCLADAVALDPELGELAEMACYHTAERVGAGQPWRIVDEMEETIRAHVREHGWHVAMVPADEDGPGYVFTIGLETTLHHPEVIMFGLDPELMAWIVNEIGRRVQGGERMPTGQPIAELLDEAGCVLAPVDPRHYPTYLGYAVAFHGGPGFRAVQCFWPIKATGQFPWDPGAPEGFVALQPDLRAAPDGDA